IARMRALEAGRYLLRSTNTGVSSVIDHKGRVVAQSPQFQTHVLNADVQPLQGRTPYALWRNYLLMVLVVCGLLVIYRRR
ncbi:MAG TPA: nitrilase-related carbon-nitrogen hydrolase, partial [Gammaproteobacteria bacterium]|nr:nitrilase-related carbon-nitrogen hydrolase [Gammaproteobacteria bacterium]